MMAGRDSSKNSSSASSRFYARPERISCRTGSSVTPGIASISTAISILLVRSIPIGGRVAKGRKIAAALSTARRVGEDDLALLGFHSQKGVAQVAKAGLFLFLEIGERCLLVPRKQSLRCLLLAIFHGDRGENGVSSFFRLRQGPAGHQKTELTRCSLFPSECYL